MNKLLFITYYWPPSGKATLHWPLKIIKYLPEFKWEPAVLTTEETSSYKDESLLKKISPDLKVYKAKALEPFELYKRFTGKSKEDPLISSETISTENKSLAHKISVWVRFNLFVPDARAGWYFSAVAKGKKILKEEQKDVIISLGPPHSSHLVGYSLSKKFKLPFVPILIDPWVDIVYYKNAKRSGMTIKADNYLEKKVMEHASKVIFVTKSTKEDYVKKYPFLKEKSNVLYWGFNEEDFRMEDGEWEMEDGKGEIGKKEEVIVHAGNIFDYQNPEQLWKRIRKEIDGGRNLRIKFIGTVSPLIKKEIERNNLKPFTEYAGFLPYKEMIEELLKASYLLVCATEKRHVPGKLFEYLRAGKPILAFGNDNEEVKNIIKESNAGMIFRYDEDPKGFFEHAKIFKTNMEYVGQYDRRKIAENFARVLRE